MSKSVTGFMLLVLAVLVACTLLGYMVNAVAE